MKAGFPQTVSDFKAEVLDDYFDYFLDDVGAVTYGRKRVLKQTHDVTNTVPIKKRDKEIITYYNFSKPLSTVSSLRQHCHATD